MVEHFARYARADKLLSKRISLEELQQNRMYLLSTRLREQSTAFVRWRLTATECLGGDMARRSDYSENSNLVPPPLFARYMAASALFSSTSSVFP